jgi:hypothetical protein
MLARRSRQVSVSGISSGAFMANQLHIAYSAIMGAGIRGVREAVGIWRGAISGNMKVSF